MTPEEKLRSMLENYECSRNDGAATGEHLSDEDFIRLTENKPIAESLPKENGNSSIVSDEFAPLRRHLADCDSCLGRFRDFYDFFAPAGIGETTASKKEAETAWKAFGTRITGKKIKSDFWTRLFPIEKKSDYFAALGWAFACLLLLFTGFAAFVAWQTKIENSQLAEQIEKQKQLSEERLKTLEQSEQNQNLTEQEKTGLQAEKDELEKRVAALRTEIEKAKKQRLPAPENNSPQIPQNSSPEKPDNSLVAVNTPIYDVFPDDSAVRGGTRSGNKLVVPDRAKNVVLILNAAGRADFPLYRVALAGGSGKIVWRGDGLRKDSTGNFTLTISRAALKTADYRLKLSSGSQIVAEYSISVEIGK